MVQEKNNSEEFTMQMKILWFGAIFFGGWLWGYLFVRQFLFDVIIANPLTDKMLAADKDLVGAGAKKYTGISIGICVFFILLACVIVIAFCPVYLIVGFFLGFVSAAVMVYFRIKITSRDMFDSFCATYYRFIPDDELRTDMYNKKPSQMKLRLHDMGLSSDFIPMFDKAK